MQDRSPQVLDDLIARRQVNHSSGGPPRPCLPPNPRRPSVKFQERFCRIKVRACLSLRCPTLLPPRKQLVVFLRENLDQTKLRPPQKRKLEAHRGDAVGKA